MRTAFGLAALLAAVSVAGCGKATPAPQSTPAPAPPPPAAAGPMFDTPEYANWKQFPIGTVVRRKSVTSAVGGAGSTTSVETFTLRQITDNEVTVDRQNTTERSDGSYKAVNPSEARKHVRQFAIPGGMTADDFAKPSRKAERGKDEVLTVLGKEYKTTVYTWTDSTEGGPMAVKLWLSDAMPGRVVKQTMTVEKLKTTTVEDVIEITVP